MDNMRKSVVLHCHVWTAPFDPALAHPVVGQTVNVLQKKQPDHEAGR